MKDIKEEAKKIMKAYNIKTNISGVLFRLEKMRCTFIMKDDMIRDLAILFKFQETDCNIQSGLVTDGNTIFYNATAIEKMDDIALKDALYNVISNAKVPYHMVNDYTTNAKKVIAGEAIDINYDIVNQVQLVQAVIDESNMSMSKAKLDNILSLSYKLPVALTIFLAQKLVKSIQQYYNKSVDITDGENFWIWTEIYKDYIL